MESSVLPRYFGYGEVLEYLGGQWHQLIHAVENSLASFSSGHVIQPVRTSVPLGKHEGFLFSMQAYDKKEEALASKLVTVYPRNKKIGLPSIQATVLHYDVTNGNLLAIMDGEVITCMRTAAASAVATKYLAPKDPKILAILGSGSQARSHYQALSHLFNFEKVHVWNIHQDSANNFVSEIQNGGQSAVSFASVEECVKDADVIVTVTMATSPILQKEWVKTGAHINAVGAPVPTWQELSCELMRSSVVYVDSKEGALVESGDIIISQAEIYAEIGEVVLGKKDAFRSETTVFKSLGMAVEDVAAAKLVYSQFLLKKGTSPGNR